MEEILNQYPIERKSMYVAAVQAMTGSLKAATDISKAPFWIVRLSMNVWLAIALSLVTLTSHASDMKRADKESSCARALELMGDRQVDTVLQRNSKIQPPAIFHPNPKKVSWQLAEKLILSGWIKTIVQSHNGSVLLLAINGQGFIAKEPEIDRAINVIGVVDPCHVFIGVVTE